LQFPQPVDLTGWAGDRPDSATLSVNVRRGAGTFAAQSQSGATYGKRGFGGCGWQLTAADGTVWAAVQVEALPALRRDGLDCSNGNQRCDGCVWGGLHDSFG